MGVWRTIKGRRVYIEEGQSVYEAMEKSGKFKNLKKKTSDNEDVISKKQFTTASKIDDDLERAVQMQVADDIGKTLSDDDIMFRAENYIRHNYHGNATTEEIYDRLKSAYKNNGTYEPQQSSSEFAKTYMREQFKAFDKGDISSAQLEQAKKDSGLSKSEIESARNYINNRAPESYPRATENKTGNTTSQPVPTSSSEKRIKAEQRLEQLKKEGKVDATGTKAVDRETQKEVNRLYLDTHAPYDEDRRIFNQIAKTYGYHKLSNEQIERTLKHAESKHMYHAQSDIDAMRRYLDRTVIEKDTGSAYSNPGKRWEVLEKSKSAYGKDIYKVRDEEGNIQWKDASSFYDKSNSDYLMRSAYQRYLKEHPNSKMKFETFKKHNK